MWAYFSYPLVTGNAAGFMQQVAEGWGLTKRVSPQ